MGKVKPRDAGLGQPPTVACPFCHTEPSYLPEELMEESFEYIQDETIEDMEFNTKIFFTEEQKKKGGLGCDSVYIRSIHFDFIDDEIEDKDQSRVIEIKQFYIRVPNEATQNVFLDSLELLCNQWAQEDDEGKKDWSLKFECNEMG